eukprot:COSAG06_NODE_2991_length_5982_cov_9.192589_1_plen_67_part_10
MFSVLANLLGVHISTRKERQCKNDIPICAVCPHQSGRRSHSQAAVGTRPEEKRSFFLSFPYVCPEPV